MWQLAKMDHTDFDNGMFSEEEVRAIKRLLPTAYFAIAKRLKRKDFFNHVFSTLKSSNLKISILKRTLYNISLGLSKRSEIETEESQVKRLSQRVIE